MYVYMPLAFIQAIKHNWKLLANLEVDPLEANKFLSLNLNLLFNVFLIPFDKTLESYHLIKYLKHVLKIKSYVVSPLNAIEN